MRTSVDLNCSQPWVEKILTAMDGGSKLVQELRISDGECPAIDEMSLSTVPPVFRELTEDEMESL